MRTTANNMFALWPGDQLNFSIFIKPTFGFVGQRAASEAGHIANTNVGCHLQMNSKVPNHITDWIRFEGFLKELVDFTTYLLKTLHGRQIDYEYQRVLFKFIERFHLNFVAIKNTWKDYLKNSKYKHPCFLLLRSLVSDYITMVYLIDGLKFEQKTLKPVEENFRLRYIEISNSYFTRVDKEIEKLLSERKLTVKQRDKFLQTEREFYPDHFETGDKIKVKKIANIDPGTMIKRIKSSEYKKLAGIYQYYFFFSQFEHFTIKTEELFQRDRDTEYKMLVGSTNYLIRGLLLNIGVMRLERPLLEKLSKVIESFEEKLVK